MAHRVPHACLFFHGPARAVQLVQHAVMDLDSWLYQLLFLIRGGRCLLCGTGYAVFGVFAAPRLDAYRLSRVLPLYFNYILGV